MNEEQAIIELLSRLEDQTRELARVAEALEKLTDHFVGCDIWSPGGDDE